MSFTALHNVITLFSTSCWRQTSSYGISCVGHRSMQGPAESCLPTSFTLQGDTACSWHLVWPESCSMHMRMAPG